MLIILLTIGLIGATLAVSLLAVDVSSRTIADDAKALYLAEAGIAQAVKTMRTQAKEGADVKQTIGPISLGEGTYRVEINYAYSIITSVGNVGNVEKRVQLHYKPL